MKTWDLRNTVQKEGNRSKATFSVSGIGKYITSAIQFEVLICLLAQHLGATDYKVFNVFSNTLLWGEKKLFVCVYTYTYIYNVYKHTYAYMCYICVIYIKCKFYNHYLTSHCSVKVTELKK